MSHIIMVTGGSRSGKSSFAEKLCVSNGQKSAYIATATIFDAEMEQRVQVHQQRREREHWQTFEVPLELNIDAQKLSQFDYILVDCLTMLIFNKMFSLGIDLDDENLSKNDYVYVENETIRFIDNYIASLGNFNATKVFVTNEIGLGIVPDSKLNRLYRDIVGKANQILAKESEEVFLVVSGIPLKIKG